jgi:hypothetical protein
MPLLEDLAIEGVDITGDNDFQPLASPPLTGTLTVYLYREMEHTIRGLLALPNGVRFRSLNCRWDLEGNLQWMMALVGACSDTLEYVEIEHNCAPLLLLQWD